MQTKVQAFIRRHDNGWYTCQLLGDRDFTTFGQHLKDARDALKEALAQEMAIGSLSPNGHFHKGLQSDTLHLELNAVQHGELIAVPLQLTMLWAADEDDPERFTVFIPRMDLKFHIRGEHNIRPWAEERIKGTLHLQPVHKLMSYRFERAERVEILAVKYHGKARYKRVLAQREVKQAATRLPTNDLDAYLSTLGTEWVSEAKAGRLPRAFAREDEVRHVIATLARPERRSVLLNGPSGVGKSSVLMEVAHRIAAGSVPARLQDVTLWHIPASRLIAGMSYVGDWQERCYKIANKVAAKGGLLFLDHLPELVRTGGPHMKAHQLFTPFVAQDRFALIVEATGDGLVQAEREATGLVRLLQRVPIDPMPTATAFDVLTTIGRRLAKPQRATLTDEALAHMLDLIARFGDGAALPGAGVALLDQMARLGAGRELTPDDAVAAFCRSSGFPNALVDPNAPLDPTEVAGFFGERIIGQPDVVGLLRDLITVIKTSLNDPGKPLGSFLFMGPTGVGKTESALSLAEYLFGSRNRLIRFDMSEYAAPGSEVRLIGGAGQTGILTDKVREQPFCVLLFDEVEKAHPGLFDILLQVLGEGRLTDGQGGLVSFRHTIVILTSNLGASQRASVGLSRKRPDLGTHFKSAANKYFRPEFVNRIDHVVPFRHLQRADLEVIAGLMLRSALNREGLQRRGITIEVDDSVLSLLLEHGVDEAYGARPMKRAIETHVLTPLSRALVRGELVGAQRISVRNGVLVSEPRASAT